MYYSYTIIYARAKTTPYPSQSPPPYLSLVTARPRRTSYEHLVSPTDFLTAPGLLAAASSNPSRAYPRTSPSQRSSNILSFSATAFARACRRVQRRSVGQSRAVKRDVVREARAGRRERDERRETRRDETTRGRRKQRSVVGGLTVAARAYVNSARASFGSIDVTSL